MTVPTPRAFNRTCDEAIENITRRINDLRELYCDPDHGAYRSSLNKPVRGATDKVMQGMSDPTAEVVGDPLDKRRPGAQAYLRKKLESANKRMKELDNELSSLEGEIRGAMDKLDPPETFEPIRYPITVTQEEIRESREKQRLRQERLQYRHSKESA